MVVGILVELLHALDLGDVELRKENQMRQVLRVDGVRNDLAGLVLAFVERVLSHYV